MALETPIVATDAGGTAEIARHDREALIIPSGDAARLAAAIRRVVVQPESARARAAAARRRVENELSFEARMRAVEGVYLDLVRERGKPGAVAAMTART
jgi:glycosyltransferase involved in cell wall biosynthesis